MAEISNVYLLLCIPIMAFLYASVGHGGASGYLLVMSLFSVPITIMRPTALVLNTIVSLVAFIQYYKVAQMQWKIFGLLVLFSIPAAYMGASITIDQSIFRKILSVVLVFSALRLFGLFEMKEKEKQQPHAMVIAIMGVSIGFISGLIGIGGGILLSPMLLLLGWTTIKETAVISAMFITLNSLSGLAAISFQEIQINYYLIGLIVLSIVGGLTGSYFGARYFNYTWLKYLLSVVIIIASIKLFIT